MPADEPQYFTDTNKCNAIHYTDMEESEESERSLDGPGMLTKAQRKYLRGESDIEEGTQRERTTRSRIRKRLVNGIQDLSLALFRLDKRDIDQVKNGINESDHDLYTTTARMLAFSSLPLEEVVSKETNYELRNNNSAAADYTVDVLPSRLKAGFHNALTDLYISSDQEEFHIRDADITSAVAFDWKTSENTQGEELRELIDHFDSGEISREELIEELLFIVSETSEERHSVLQDVLALRDELSDDQHIDSDQ
jgi:hypothetical protein